jgi:hypothetical protein
MPATVRRPVDELVCEVGDDVVISGQFTNDVGVPTDPANVSCRIVGPNTLVLFRFGPDAVVLHGAQAGTYSLVWKVPTSGRFYWRLWGDGGGVVERAHVGTIVALADPTAGNVWPPFLRAGSPVSVALV